MYLIKHDDSSGVSMFQLELSEGELILYESCLYYVSTHCAEKNIYDKVGCENNDELSVFQKDLLRLLIKYVDKRSLPERFYGRLPVLSATPPLFSE